MYSYPQRPSSTVSDLLQMINEFCIMRDGQLGRVRILEHCTDFANDDVRQVHTAAYQFGPTSRQFTAVVINLVITKTFFETATKNCVDCTILFPKNMTCFSSAYIEQC